jgi:multiple sugar transport system ATP-binding protein
VGARPEHFEDASIVGDRPGLTFETDVSLVESLGSDLFAYFDYEGEGVVAEELAELAADSGVADVPSTGEANQAIARLEPASDIQAGRRARLWLDTTKLHLFDPSTGDSLTVQRPRSAAAATTPA